LAASASNKSASTPQSRATRTLAASSSISTVWRFRTLSSEDRPADACCAAETRKGSLKRRS